MEPRISQPTTVVQPVPRAFPRSRPESRGSLLRWLNYLLQTRPMAFWGSVWVSVFLVAIVATGSLLSPNAAERRSVSAIALGSDSAVATQPIDSQGKVPVWIFGAVAITCTAGSLLVSRRLKPSTRPRSMQSKQALRKPTMQPSMVQQSMLQPPMVQSMAQTGARSLNPRTVRKRVPVAKQKPQRTKQPKRLKPYSPVEPFMAQSGISRHSKVHPPASPVSSASIPVVVVPKEHIHPLDFNQTRLADTLDLRQRKSSQTWMKPSSNAGTSQSTLPTNPQ